MGLEMTYHPFDMPKQIALGSQLLILALYEPNSSTIGKWIENFACVFHSQKVSKFTWVYTSIV